MSMVRKNLFNDINEKLTFLSMMITNGASLNLLELNVHAENFYASLFNLVFNLHLENVNTTTHNVASIDLIDNKNKIFVQVTSNATKSKIENTLKKNILKNYNDYNLLFIFLGSNDSNNLIGKKYINPHNIKFNSSTNIYNLKNILSHIMNLETEKLEDISNFINCELKFPVEKKKLDSDLTKVINALSKEQFSEMEAPNTLPFQVEEKIEFNKLRPRYDYIKDYDAYMGILAKKYNEFDRLGKNSSFVILKSLKSEYRHLKELYSDSVQLFDKIIEITKTKVKETNNIDDVSEEMLDFCVWIIIVDAFLKCQIFENPEGYKYAIT